MGNTNVHRNGQKQVTIGGLHFTTIEFQTLSNCKVQENKYITFDKDNTLIIHIDFAFIL